MPIGALYPPLSAFSAYGSGLNNTAHNLANVATNNFKAGRMNYSEGPQQAGVKATGAQQMQQASGQGTLSPTGPGLPPPPGADPGLGVGFSPGSSTNVATEMVGLITASQGYQANARTVDTANEMLGTIVNLKA